MLVHFRKRLKPELIGQINEAIVQQVDLSDSTEQAEVKTDSNQPPQDNGFKFAQRGSSTH